MDGAQPSPQVRDLIRQCAQVVVNAPAEWLEELDRAVLGANPAIASDPELAAAVSRSNRSNLLVWGAANVRDPGAPVPANAGTEPMSVAREMVRRGVDMAILQTDVGRAEKLNDLSLGKHRDVGSTLDPFDEIA